MSAFLHSIASKRLVPLLFLPVLLVIADTENDTRSETEQLADYYLSNTICNLDDLVLTFDMEQASWLPIVPPSPDFILRQDSDLVVFNPKDFPDSFTQRLIPEPFDGGWIYPVLAMEDSITRDRLFFNTRQELIARIPASPGYNPYWLLEERYPDLNNGTYTTDQIMSLRALHDPARMVLRFPLILKNDLLKHLAKASVERATKAKDKGKDGSIVMKAYEGPPLTNIQITATEIVSNGIRLTFAYPWNGSTYPTNSFTNRLEIFRCNDLVAFWWTTSGVVNVSASTNWVEWTDTTAGGTNTSPRFYIVGNADMDSDSDLLTDAQEKFLYHSSPTNTDTDGDTLSDYTEVISLNTDPCNSDTNKPVVNILTPTNGMSWVWMP